MKKLWAILLLAGAAPQEAKDRSPVDLALSADGKWALTANATSDTASLVDLAEGKVVAEVAVGKRPFGVAWRGEWAVVTNLLDESATILRVAPPRLESAATVEVGYQPRGAAVRGDRAFVALSGEDAVVALDLREKKVAGRVAVGTEPWHLALTPDGKRLVVGNTGSQDVSLVDTETMTVASTVPMKGRNLRHVAVSPDGAWAYVPHIADRLGPTTVPSIEDGKVLDNRLGRVPLGKAGPREVLALDTKGFASGDLDGVAVSPDGKTIAVSVSGTRTLLLLTPPLPFVEAPGDHMDAALHKDKARYRRVLGLRGRPLGLSFLPDGKRLAVANYLSNTVQIVDVEKAEVAGAIPLGGSPEPSTPARKGEAIFHDAYRSWHEWFSCATCHVEGDQNGGMYDTFNDGKFGNPKRVLSLRGVARTGPWTWHGQNADLGQSVQGSLVRTMGRAPALPSDLEALLAYLKTVDFVPPARGSRTEGARRGEALFKSKACDTCHVSPLYQDKGVYGVGLESPGDAFKGFNPPSLRGVGRRMPYLHDGRAKTLEEVLERHHTPSKLTDKPDFTPAELQDVVAFLRSL